MNGRPRPHRRRARRGELLTFNPALLAYAIGYEDLDDAQRRCAAALLMEVPEVAAVSRSVQEVIDVCETTPAADWLAMAAAGGSFSVHITP